MGYVVDAPGTVVCHLRGTRRKGVATVQGRGLEGEGESEEPWISHLLLSKRLELNELNAGEGHHVGPTDIQTHGKAILSAVQVKQEVVLVGVHREDWVGHEIRLHTHTLPRARASERHRAQPLLWGKRTYMTARAARRRHH